jgi:hypothetical protein
MKSIINSDEVKKLVADAVEKALIECAAQHEANSEPYVATDGTVHLPEHPLPALVDSQPIKLKLTFNLFWTQDETDRKVPDMWCQPIIDLTSVIGD